MKTQPVIMACFSALLLISCGDGGDEGDAAEDTEELEEGDGGGEDTRDGADGAEEGEGGAADAAGDAADSQEEDAGGDGRVLASRVLLGEGGFFGVSGREVGRVAGPASGSFAVGAHYADISGGVGEEQPAGRLYVFDDDAFPSSVADASLVLEPPDGALGGGFAYAIGNPCDFDGDGNLDLAVGNHLYSPPAAPNSGRVVVFWGEDGGGLSVDRATYHALSADLVRSSDSMGQTVLCADFDEDGFDDLLATGQNAGPDDTGMGAIFHGGPGGLPANQDMEIYPAVAASRQYLGCSSLYEDIDGDGTADLAIGGWGLIKGEDAAGPHTGGVAVFPGGTDWSGGPAYGLFSEGSVEISMGIDMAVIRGPSRSFLVVSATQYSSPPSGALFIYVIGSADFYLQPPMQTLVPPPGMLETGFGNAVAYIPDFHGAGQGALLTGMKYGDASPDDPGTGLVAVYALAADGDSFVETPGFLTAPDPKPNDAFGGAIVEVGDIDGNGLGDFFVGMESHIEGDIMTGIQTGGVVFFH